MSRILLSHNKNTGVSNYFHADSQDAETYTVETVQTGLDHIASYCNEAREANKFKGFGDGAMDFKIPAAMAGELMRKGLLFDPAYMARWKKEHPEYSLRGGQKYFKGGM